MCKEGEGQHSSDATGRARPECCAASSRGVGGKATGARGERRAAAAVAYAQLHGRVLLRMRGRNSRCLEAGLECSAHTAVTRAQPVSVVCAPARATHPSYICLCACIKIARGDMFAVYLPARQDSARRGPRRAAAMRQPSSGSAHKKNDDIGNEEQDLDALEFDGVLLQDRCAEPASPNPLATAASGAHFLAVE